ncbi:MAG: helix-turn-helix transcriptional regulator [Planctomycetes bacterium]|nr:helix-turn-helix transcriptional regulator [Planctomycetota bacterium]
MEPQHVQDIGAVIRFHRKQSGLSQRGLADMAGVGKTAVFDLEKGKTSVRLDTLTKVCRVLNIRLLLDSPLMEQWQAQQQGDSQGNGEGDT